MIDYQLYCQIKDYQQNHHLTAAQIARELHLDERTVAKWLAQTKFSQRPTVPRPSKLDAFKPQIVRWLAHHPYTATQIFLRLRECGFAGGISIVKDYVHQVRPPRAPAGTHDDPRVVDEERPVLGSGLRAGVGGVKLAGVLH